jgi:hypothetical protein
MKEVKSLGLNPVALQPEQASFSRKNAGVSGKIEFSEIFYPASENL